MKKRDIIHTITFFIPFHHAQQLPHYYGRGLWEPVLAPEYHPKAQTIFRRVELNTSHKKFFFIPLLNIIFVVTILYSMGTVTIKIDTKSKKARYLLDFITELSKTENGITVFEEKSEFMKSFDKSFEELELAKKGRLKTKSARELLDEL